MDSLESNGSETSHSGKNKSPTMCIVPRYRERCPCGRSKDRMLQAVKLDASQFYKSASVERGINSVCQLLDRVEEKMGKNAVAIYRAPRCKGYLCGSAKKDSSLVQVVTFNEIRCACRYSKHDNRFLLGDCVFKRRGGWPMGASLSEPATMCDVNDRTHIYIYI